MKYITSIITMIFVVCFLSLGNVAVAQEQKSQEDSIFNSAKSSKDWNVMVGYKGWFSKWQTFALYNFSEQSGVVSSVSETVYTHIPVLGFRYKKFFISASYMKTYFRFPNLSNMERKEGDISLTYYINRYFGITAGYKMLHINQKISFYNQDFNLKQKLEGPTIGFMGSIPIGKKGFGLYSAFSYGRLESNFYFNGDEAIYTDDEKLPYYVGELGLSYSPRIQKHVKFLNSANVYAGYRFQNLYMKNLVEGGDGKYSTDGFVVGFNLSF
ncbi:secreted protein [Beggiatoa sp. PS]|nr:secreted protein [Beggiatoa sp. PS]